MTIKKIKLIIGGILLLIVTILIFWPKNKETVNIIKQESTTEKAITIPKPPFTMDSPKKIEWSLAQTDGEKINEVLITEKQNISEVQNKKFTELMGLNYDSRQLNSDQISIIGGGGKKHINIYLKSSSLEYGEDIENKNQLDNSSKKSIDQLKNGLTETLNKIFEVDKLSYKIDSISYRQFIYPRWVSSSEIEADTVEIEANYLINGTPLVSFNGSPIKATYAWSGKLVKLQIQLPPTIKQRNGNYNLVTVEEMKSLPIKSFYVYKIVADKNYELEAVQEKIDTVNVTSGYISYVYDSSSNITAPYWFLEGNSQLGTKTAKVVIITPAIVVK